MASGRDGSQRKGGKFDLKRLDLYFHISPYNFCCHHYCHDE